MSKTAQCDPWELHIINCYIEPDTPACEWCSSFFLRYPGNENTICPRCIQAERDAQYDGPDAATPYEAFCDVLASCPTCREKEDCFFSRAAACPTCRAKEEIINAWWKKYLKEETTLWWDTYLERALSLSRTPPKE